MEKGKQDTVVTDHCKHHIVLASDNKASPDCAVSDVSDGFESASNLWEPSMSFSSMAIVKKKARGYSFGWGWGCTEFEFQVCHQFLFLSEPFWLCYRNPMQTSLKRV